VGATRAATNRLRKFNPSGTVVTLTGRLSGAFRASVCRGGWIKSGDTNAVSEFRSVSPIWLDELKPLLAQHFPMKGQGLASRGAIQSLSVSGISEGNVASGYRSARMDLNHAKRARRRCHVFIQRGRNRSSTSRPTSGNRHRGAIDDESFQPRQRAANSTNRSCGGARRVKP
jgi:hypothetical protein